MPHDPLNQNIQRNAAARPKPPLQLPAGLPVRPFAGERRGRRMMTAISCSPLRYRRGISLKRFVFQHPHRRLIVLEDDPGPFGRDSRPKAQFVQHGQRLTVATDAVSVRKRHLRGQEGPGSVLPVPILSIKSWVTCI